MSNIKLRSSSAAAFSSDDAEDNDSVTSGDLTDTDREYVVEEILAERYDEILDKKELLIVWEGYPIHKCTWEAATGLSKTLKDDWNATKREIEAGTKKPFDVSIFEEAVKKYETDKRNRHRQRLLKRKSRGERLTGRQGNEAAVAERDIYLRNLQNESESDTEDRNQAVVDTKQNGSKKIAETRKSRAAPGTSSSKTATDPRRPSKEPKVPALASKVQSSTSRSKNAPPPKTDHKETARKVSSPKIRSVPIQTTTQPKTAAVRNTPVSAASVSSQSVGPSTRARTARKMSTNIFARGQVRKERVGLAETARDASKNPKLFGNMHLRRMAELNSRNKEDTAPSPKSVAGLFRITDGPKMKSPVTAPVTSLAAAPEKVEPSRPVTDDASNKPSGAATVGLMALGLENRILAAPVASAPAKTLLLAAPAVPMTVEDGPSLKMRKLVSCGTAAAEQAALVNIREDAEPGVFVTEPQTATCTRKRKQMDVDEGRAQKGGDGEILPRDSSPKKLSVAAYREKNIVRHVMKKVRLGQSPLMAVTFTGIPQDTSQPWVAKFLDAETLELSHSCLAMTVASQGKSVVDTKLCQGHLLASAESEQAVRWAAEYLRTHLCGLYWPGAEFSVLVYPTRCEEWNSLISPGQDPTSSGLATIPLKFIVFAPPFDGIQMVPSLEQQMPDPQDQVPEAQVVTRSFFGWDYSRLLPSASIAQTDAHNFYLAFPADRMSALMFLSIWLRACNPRCHIYVSQDAGSWEVFQDAVKKQAGSVIAHEMLDWTWYRFPSLGRRLLKQHDTYWSFSEPVRPKPLFPSVGNGAEVAGRWQFNRLFPDRWVFLMTPSFVLSEPEYALQFLHWFLKRHEAHSLSAMAPTLVTAFNIHVYLRHLAIDKEQARKTWLETSKQIEAEAIANLRGLGKLDNEFRSMVADAAEEIYRRRTYLTMKYGVGEDELPLVYADECIDPNDEQSLVNWFACWTNPRFDQYRVYIVLGSTPSPPGADRLSREVDIPRYTRETVNDPDTLMQKLKQGLGVVERRDSQLQRQISQTHDAQRQTGAENTSGATALRNWPPRRSWLQTEILDNMHPKTISKYVGDLSQKKYEKYRTWLLYKFPTSWADLAMADHYGDKSCAFKKLDEWWNFARPWPASRTTMPAFNSYIGFFWTPIEDWTVSQDGQVAKASQEHRSWLALYRPVNLFHHPWAPFELLIWDPTAPRMFPKAAGPQGRKQEISEGDLIYVQRQLIRLVKHRAQEKYPGSFLKQVWLGGFETFGSPRQTHDIDATLAFLNSAVSDLESMKHFFPAPETRLPYRGFRKVVPTPGTGLKDGHDSAGVPTNLDNYRGIERDDDAGEPRLDNRDDAYNPDLRMIFHPPRATGRWPLKMPTRCRNRLYTAAERAREEGCIASHRGDPATNRMTFTFAPTKEWYQEQEDEGRAFEHLIVEPWPDIVKMLHLAQSASHVRSDDAPFTSNPFDQERPGSNGDVARQKPAEKTSPKTPEMENIQS